MTDIALAINADNEIDIAETADLAGDDTIRTAILLSLFTDRRADPSEIPRFQSDPRGYWGDHISQSQFRTGSRLWLHTRSKNSPIEVAQIVTSCREALDWLIEDGHVQRLEVQPRVLRDNLSLNISFDQSVMDIRIGGFNGV